MPVYKLKASSILILLILTTFVVYKGGLNGGFIFDDYNSLQRLNVFQGDVTAEKLKTYVGESGSGPLKRPISVLSFLIDSQQWPTEAYAFKRTNLIIHIINGSLLFLILLKLFHLKGLSDRKILFVAGLSAAFWMLHPFLVSTTLYVVQRMAMLPLTFMLLGFLMYLHARSRYQHSEFSQGRLLLFIAVYAMTVLAMLSKENGAIFLWLVPLFECFIVRKYLQFNPLSKKLNLWLLILPAIALAVLIIIQIPSFIDGYDSRAFDMWQRLLTQTRVISEYLYHLFLPSYFTVGVFTDGYSHSRSLISPLSSLWCSLFIVALLVLAWLKRKTWVWFSFAVFFFFIAQFIESTIVPLELYYEHRVYVASIFLAVPLVLVILKLIETSKIYILVPTVMVLLLSMVTYMRTDIWSNNLQLHHLSTEKHPQSVRVFVATAVQYEQMRLTGDALMMLKKGAEIHDSLEIQFNITAIYCNLGSIEQKHIDKLNGLLVSVPFYRHDQNSFVSLIRLLYSLECLGESTLDAVESIANAAEKNPNIGFINLRSIVYFMKGYIAQQRKQFELAEQLYFKSFEGTQGEYPSMHTAVMAMIKDGELDRAKRILDYEAAEYKKDFKLKFDWLDVGENIKRTGELISDRQNEKNIDHNTSQE